MRIRKIAGMLLICLAVLWMMDVAVADSLVLPSGIRQIEEMAFMNDPSVTEVVIQENVEYIGPGAFSGCTSLRTVTFLSRDVRIARNAFEGCPQIVFQVYEGSSAELFALCHGYRRAYLDGGSSIYDRIMQLIGQYTSEGSTLQGKESKRVIIRVSGDHLPDISEYEPISIVPRSESIYFVQFATEEATVACYEAMQARVGQDVVYAEYDDSTSAIDDEVSAAGIVRWAKEDPMGFDTYAPYVAGVQSGSVKIAVIDSGVNRGVTADSINLIQDGQSNQYDGCRHGSLIASIIRECTGNTNVSIMSVRVVNNRNQTTPSLLGMGIAYAVEHGANILNLSLNTSASAYVQDELQAAMQSAKVIVAAGNDNINTSKVFPANVSGTIVVSGLQDEETIWHESNTGSQVMFSAPAVGLSTPAYSSIPSGTSFAAPMISAAYALVSLDSTHNIKDMIDSCVDLGSTGRDSVYGFGMPDLNVLAALKVTSIEVENAPTLMFVGDEVDLSLKILPARALDRTVACSSSDETVLAVSRSDEGGIQMTGMRSGQVRVTITANDGGGASVAFDVRVVQETEHVTIQADSDELPMTRTMALSVAVEPATADNREISWSSSNVNVATVSADGVVTPVSPGETVIRADAMDGYGAWDELRLNVIEIPEAETVVISAEGKSVLPDEVLSVRPNDEIQLLAQVYPVDAEQDVTWNLSVFPTNAATIDQNGKLKTLSSGTAFITATTGNRVSGQFTISIMVMPTAVTMTGDNIVNVGEQMTLTAEVAPVGFVTNPNVLWLSSNEEVATVDQTGTVTGIAGGEAMIFAKAEADESIQASKLVTVRQMPQKLELSGDTEIFTTYATQLSTQITPANVYDTTVVWTSSDTEVASVSETGLVTAVGPGTATISAVCAADETVGAVLTVTVKNEWTGWTAWSTSPAQPSDDMEVESRTEYRYQNTTYGNWGEWSDWTKSRQSTSDTKMEDVATVYGWYYFQCANCGYHHKYHGSSCPKCSATVPESGWHSYLTNQPWNASFQSYTDSKYGLLWSWSDSHGSSQTGTGYRYATRTKTVSDWSAWSTEAVTEYETDQEKRAVEKRTTYRYRLRNTFGESVISGWVTEDQVPSDAQIVNTRWVYTEKMESNSATMDGWTQASADWKQTGSGSVRSASFASYPGFDKGNALYKTYNISPPTANTTETTKRTVSSSTDGWIYWHWMYSVSASAYDRVILYQTGYGPSGHTTAKYYYRYFQAYESRTNFNKTSANDGQDTTLYSWYLNQSDHTSNAESGGSWYWYRIPITKTTYTDYVRNYTYTREMETTTEPENMANIVSMTKYVQYMISQ